MLADSSEETSDPLTVEVEAPTRVNYAASLTVKCIVKPSWPGKVSCSLKLLSYIMIKTFCQFFRSQDHIFNLKIYLEDHRLHDLYDHFT